MLHCSVNLARVVRLTEESSVIYLAEQNHCRRAPGAASADLRGGLPELSGRISALGASHVSRVFRPHNLLRIHRWFEKQGYSTQGREYSLVYANGDNKLKNLRRVDQR